MKQATPGAKKFLTASFQTLLAGALWTVLLLGVTLLAWKTQTTTSDAATPMRLNAAGSVEQIPVQAASVFEIPTFLADDDDDDGSCAPGTDDDDDGADDDDDGTPDNDDDDDGTFCGCVPDGGGDTDDDDDGDSNNDGSDDNTGGKTGTDDDDDGMGDDDDGHPDNDDEGDSCSLGCPDDDDDGIGDDDDGVPGNDDDDDGMGDDDDGHPDNDDGGDDDDDGIGDDDDGVPGNDDDDDGVCKVATTTDPELRIEITNLIDEPAGGWEPGNTIKLGINLCNNEFNDAFSDGLCQGSATWDNPVTDRDIKTKVLLPSRLSYADNATCTLDTDGDGQFDDGACPGGSFNIVATAEPLIVIDYPDLPVGQGAQVIFETTLTDGATENIEVSSEISQGSPADEDATADNCNLAGGAPGIGEDDCDKLVFAVQPVELTRFDADLDGRTARLVWETASETNNAGFEVQHRPAEAGSFAVLGFVEGHGTTLDAQSYSFTVADLTPGRHVFRLKQIDFDGTFEYSPEVEVSVEMPEAYFVSEIYPNPFNPQATLQFAVRQSQQVEVSVYNMLGQRVLDLYRGVSSAGVTQTVQIDGSRLVTGTYVVQITGERFVETQTVTLVK